MRAVLDARTATDHFPGIGRYVTALGAALARVAPDLDLTLLKDPLAPVARLTLPPLPEAACHASPFSLAQQWRVPAELRRQRATLYHSPYYLMPYMPGVPSVVTIHDLIPMVYPAYYTAGQRLIFRVACWLALRRANVVVVDSEATRRDLARFFRCDPARVTVAPLAAAPVFRRPEAGQVAAARGKYGLPARYVLYVGSNKPHKNLERLVEAWSTVAGSPGQAPAGLVIAGHWDARYPEAQRLAEARGLTGRVHFLGPVAEADLPALYGGALLFVFPSLYEGFGLPVLEAMACGTAVLCSHSSSLPEVAGRAAVLVDPLDVASIAAGLSLALGDTALRQELCLAGQARAAEFTWERTARMTLDAYRRAGA